MTKKRVTISDSLGRVDKVSIINPRLNIVDIRIARLSKTDA